MFKKLTTTLTLLFVLCSLFAAAPASPVSANQPERLLVAGDVNVCGTMVHFEGTLSIQNSGSLYHVMYNLDGLDAAGATYSAHPQVTVRIREGVNTFTARQSDRFDVVKHGEGRVSHHNAGYNLVFVDGRLVHADFWAEDSCR